jgi:hypothetical protein
MIDYRQFGKRLLEIILLLIGLYIFNTALFAIVMTMDLREWMIPFMTNSYWVGNLIFGIIIYRLTRQTNKVSVSIGLLSTVLPVFGGLFYLLTLTTKENYK